MKINISVIVIFIFCSVFSSMAQDKTFRLPEGFVYVDEVIPDIISEIRYAGKNNFIGKPIAGYDTARAIISKSAALALSKVQKELIQKDLMLKIFDAYRPQRAVDHFVKWAADKADTLKKARFYPDIPKDRLFELGYISTRSGHSRGSTVDLTLVKVANCAEVDMGGPYDFFGEISHHNSKEVSQEQKNNRETLRLVMRKYGFRSYSEEWWHYTYDAEPFPDTYYNFPVR
ncbi:M15 family metallopeptidase [Christiangramia sabulilitoris]|uniref:D-alanyl-D-alanine dipeptidase n=1 Tax=Christiangramia sabulilitoris TaxID=2583991 RepID=A0A550I7R5_9FLAO|nr:M15 family metallopeptidase [Christiangramia sabulilitoris]TRO67010.1 M15 family metallopeptidase [Christiangramia sabulilitoris]